jgi:hypothetical protein
MSTNPYSAPTANVSDPASATHGNYVPGGQTVAAGRGWDWITAGWDLFKRQAGMWIALVLVAFVIFLVLAFIPFLGNILTTFLSIFFGAGVLIGCRAIEDGGALEIGHLFAGFREKFAPLAAVAGIYLGVTIAIVVLVMLVAGVSVFGAFSGGGDISFAAMMTGLLAALVVLALMLPVVMAVWFAPALVVFQDKGAVEAMKESFSGCLRNVVPFLVYGAIGLVLSILASIPLMLGWLALGPVFAGSMYASYKDIYLTS